MVYQSPLVCITKGGQFTTNVKLEPTNVKKGFEFLNSLTLRPVFKYRLNTNGLVRAGFQNYQKKLVFVSSSDFVLGFRMVDTRARKLLFANEIEVRKGKKGPVVGPKAFLEKIFLEHNFCKNTIFRTPFGGSERGEFPQFVWRDNMVSKKQIGFFSSRNRRFYFSSFRKVFDVQDPMMPSLINLNVLKISGVQLNDDLILTFQVQKTGPGLGGITAVGESQSNTRQLKFRLCPDWSHNTIWIGRFLQKGQKTKKKKKEAKKGSKGARRQKLRSRGAGGFL